MSRGGWLPWRRDWSRYPNVWKVYAAQAVVWAVVAALYLSRASLIGLFWVGLAVADLALSLWVRRRSRAAAPATTGRADGDYN